MSTPAGQPGAVRPLRWLPAVTGAAALVLAGAAAHLAYLIFDCPLDLSGDEAHYWEWSRRLDLSYYSKGPLVAYLIALSRSLLADWSQRVVGNEALAVRVPAILLSVATAMGIFALAAQCTRAPRVALAVVAITLTIPIFAVGALLMTIDAPLACLYVWTLVAIVHGLGRDSVWPWLAAGLLIALGMLAKYTMVLIFPVVGVTMLLEPALRRHWSRPGPYAATLIGLTGLLPIVIWNAQHNWVSFRHVAGQAGVSATREFHLFGPLEMIAGQAAVFGPVWLFALVWGLARMMREWRAVQPAENADWRMTLLASGTITPWLVFGGFSFVTKIQPNWPVLAYLPGVILLAWWLGRLWQDREAAARRAARGLVIAGVVVGGAATVVMHRSDWLMPLYVWLARSAPPWDLTPVARYDPSARLRGWSTLGAAVGDVLQAQRAAGRDPFIATDDYQAASQIAFYCPGHPITYCFQSVLGDRRSQYDLWRPNPVRDPEAFAGRPVLYVGARKPLLFGNERDANGAFVNPQLVRTAEYSIAGNKIQTWTIYVAEAFRSIDVVFDEIPGVY